MNKTLVVRGTARMQRTLRALEGRELQNRVRRGTRAGAAVMRAELRRQARSGNFPATFAKTATRGHRTPVGTSTGPSTPLINIFEGGAGAHTIAPEHGLLLSGKAGTRWRDRDFAASEPVHHPGMGARPLIGPVFDATHDEASEAAFDAIMDNLP